jgi:hypothetical protein
LILPDLNTRGGGGSILPVAQGYGRLTAVIQSLRYGGR